MKKLYILLAVLSFVATPLYAQVLPPVGSGNLSGGSSSSGGGTTITSGTGDFGTATSQSGAVLTGVVTGGTNLVGTIGATNSIGVIAGAGTASCVMTGVINCSMTVGGGAITLALPTGMSAGVTYHLIITSTAAVTITPASGWQTPREDTGAFVATVAFTSGPAGTVLDIPFRMDTAGTNANLATSYPDVSAKRGIFGSTVGGTITGTGAGITSLSTANFATFDAGTIGSGGTAACDFSSASICKFSVGAGAATIGLPTNMATGQIYYLRITGTGSINLTWNAAWKYYNLLNNTLGSPAGFSINNGSLYTIAFIYDGTEPIEGLLTPDLSALSLQVQGAAVGSGGFTFSSDNTVHTMARMPLAFSINQQTALIANEHMGTFKTVKAITIENIVLDAQNVTCAVSATATCYDCGTSAGACTSAQTSTIATSAAIATGAVSSVDVTITTASVAAGHYISCQITAGTCATLQASISMMARPQ